jgi:hypothetical protein
MAVRVSMPRWLLVLEGLLLLAALVVIAYKLAIRVRPIGQVVVEQYPREADPAERAREYFVTFPERYLRIANESWRSAQGSGIALHSFTIRNSATVGYRAIEVRFVYRSGAGKELGTRVVALEGEIAPGQVLKFSDLKVTGVPPQAESAAAGVVKAVVNR